MKARKIPMRKCLGCNENKPKKDLIRVVKTTEGEVLVDFTGKVNGRGAYICPDTNCLEKAIDSKAIFKSLSTGLSPEVVEKIKNDIIKEIDNKGNTFK